MTASFLPVVANWASGVRDVYSFNTDIFSTRDGSEQRRSLMAKPRRTIGASVLLDGTRQRLFYDAVNAAKDGLVEIPDYSADPARLTIAAANGDPLVTVAKVPSWAKTGAVVALLVGRRSYRLTVDYVTGLNIVLLPSVTIAAPAGAILLPVLPGTLTESTSIAAYTDSVQSADIEVRVTPGTTLRVPEPVPFESGPVVQILGPAGLLYGRYVLLRKPNYLEAPKITIELGYTQVDYGRGTALNYTPVPITARTLTASYVTMARTDVMEILDIFLRARGRAGEIYVPTWGSDFPAPIAVSGATITFAGSTVAANYAGDGAHKSVLIRTTTGTLLPREVQSIATVDGDTRITFDSAIGVTVGSISQISWMFVARFAQDTLTIQWLNNELASISLSFITLANLPVEELLGSNWILATGQWRDLGQWEDTAVWIDGI